MPLIEFNAVINGYIKHVEQYQKYLYLKSQMKQIEKNLLFEEHPQPIVKDSSGLKDEPISADEIVANLENFIEELELNYAVFGVTNKN